MSVDYKLLGQHVRTARKTAGRTQESLAEALSVSVGYVSQIERGVTKVSLDTLANVAVFLQCDIAELISGVERGRREYLCPEFLAAFGEMDECKKRLLLEIAQCILAN